MENQPLHTLLGSTGAVGTETAKALAQYPVRIRLVSRHPKKVNDSDELMAADLLDPAAVLKAVEGSEVVYVTIGFLYDAKFWEKIWVPFLRSTIDACAAHKAKLVFFDNNYMYAPSEIPNQTEESRLGTSTRKGAVRLAMVELLLEAHKAGKVNMLIARSADFYGPNVLQRSVLLELTYENLKKGKAANWLFRGDKLHTFTYTPDIGRAMAQLGNTPEAFGQTWHVPTSKEAYTGEQWAAKVAEAMGVPLKFQVMPAWLVSVLGLFVLYLKEVKEMHYQYDQDYRFHSDKYEAKFEWTATPIKQGIAETIAQSKVKSEK